MANETLTDVFSDIADAVRAKGVTGQMTPLQMPAKITSIPSGGETPEAEWKDVNFIDYDGKNLYSYTTAEALALTELPPAPDRTSEGLTFQEWNYTLSEMKANANASGKCIVGATYTTTDGATHLFISISDESQLSVTLKFNQKTGTSNVDWGDESTPTEISTTGSQTLNHVYQPASYPANYRIKIMPTSNDSKVGFETGIFGAGITSVSENNKNVSNYYINKKLKKVFIGGNLTVLDSPTTSIAGPFSACNELEYITIPNTTQINSPVFYQCETLNCVVLPNISIARGEKLFKLSGIKLVSIPGALSSLNTSMFYGCCALNKIHIPQAITYVNKAFEKCYSISDTILIPNVSRLYEYAFDDCSSITKIVFTSSVGIEQGTFRNCYGLSVIDFTNVQSVPTLYNTNAFQNTNANLKIIVPDALYEDWIGASNWSSLASKIVKASEA